MPYNHLMNARCLDGFPRCKWAKLGRTGASQASVAIDELGRLFTWGQNYWGQCGQGDPCWSAGVELHPELEEIEFATQLGAERNWIKSTSGEYSSMALNTKGELWGWGEAEDNCEAFGLPLDSGVSHTQCFTGVPIPGSMNLFYFPVLCTPSYLWKDFAHCYYYTLGIGLDNKLYSWGMNYDYGLGASVTEGVGFATPILNPTLTADIKLVDCELMCNAAVTVDDRVYVWGVDWWQNQASWNFDSEVPMEITGLVIPSGETIVSISVSYWLGVIVLLSNGELHAAGSSFLFGDQGVAYPTGTQTFQRVTCFDPKKIVMAKITALGASALWVIDENGNIWGWSEGNDHFVGNDPDPSPDWELPNLIASEYEGQNVFIDAVLNTHNITFQAIDDRGYLWTWGWQGWGPHLAIGAKGEAADVDPYITDIVIWRFIAGYAEPPLDYRGEFLSHNTLPTDESDYLQPLPQMLRHKPCGHWHLRLFEGEELWPCNCWMPSISIYDNDLMFVACGKHLQAHTTDTGCEVIVFDYDIDTNIWTLASYTELVNAANAPGGASIYDDTMIFANWKADASGKRFNEIYTNFCLGVWVWDKGNSYDLNYTEFASKDDMYMQGKAAAYSGGVAAVAYENSAGQLLVQVTTDYGATWNLRKTVGVDALREDYSLCIDKNGYIFLAHQISTSAVMVERSLVMGLIWTTRIASNYMIPDMTSLKTVADNDMLFLFAHSAVGSAIERSSNGGTSWSTISGEPYASARVSSGCNVADGHSDIVFVTAGIDLNNYLYDTDYGGYNWLERTIPQISDEGLEINTYQGPYLADLAGYNGRFAYSAYTFYTVPVPYVAVALSPDRGQTWAVRGTPLGWALNANELGDFRGCPLFCLTDVPHLNHIWTFEKSNWAAEFVKQKDKYKVERPCICPPYRGI